LKFFGDESSIHLVLDESSKSEIFDLDATEVDFLGAENILSNSLDANFFMRVIYITCLMKALKVKSLIWMLTKLTSLGQKIFYQIPLMLIFL
jgi:hypothetical protein